LCPFGDLQTADGELPGWEFPQPEQVMLRSGADGNFLEFAITPGWIAEVTGAFCYTPYIKIKPDTYYQVAFEINTDAPRVIQFTKGYRDRAGGVATDNQILRQEVFKHQVRYHGDNDVWSTLTSRPFLPRAQNSADAPQYLRVQLYAYYPAGTVKFRRLSIYECRRRTAAP
jgi:hypothetical protein